MKSLLALTLLFSTVCGVKTSYFILRYERFADKVIERHDSFDNQEWEETIAKYQEFRAQYKELSGQMSNEERSKIDQLNHKLNALIIKDKASKVFGTVGEFVNEAAGTVKELFK